MYQVSCLACEVLCGASQVTYLSRTSQGMPSPCLCVNKSQGNCCFSPNFLGRPFLYPQSKLVILPPRTLLQPSASPPHLPPRYHPAFSTVSPGSLMPVCPVAASRLVAHSPTCPGGYETRMGAESCGSLGSVLEPPSGGDRRLWLTISSLPLVGIVSLRTLQTGVHW